MKFRTRVYRKGELLAEDFPQAEISDWLAKDDTIVWLDMETPDVEELHVLADEFELSPLAVEDATSERQRPKLDRYSDHVFISMYGLHLTDDDQLHSSELAVFAAPRFLITVRKDGLFDMARVVTAWDNAPKLAAGGVGFLLWGLLDVVVDGHFATAQTYDERLDDLEDVLFDTDRANLRPTGGVREVQKRSFQLRKSLVLYRRLVMPMREVVNALLRGEMQLVDEQMQPYFQDVYDHVLRASEWGDGLRDLVGTIVETNLTVQGNVLNEVMKKLTAYAAIVAVPTAVTGFFGQNVPYPGFGKAAGFWASIGIMIAIAGALVVAFRRRAWL